MKESHARRAVGHRLRLHEALGGEQRRPEGDERRGKHHDALDDRQGTHGRGGQVLQPRAQLPQSGNVLHQQKHFGKLPAGEEEKRHGQGAGTLRQPQRTLLVTLNTLCL